VIQDNADREVQAELHSTYDSSSDMGYIYLGVTGTPSQAG
jgi:hypothetical protein